MWTLGNKQRVFLGGWVSSVMDIKEGTDFMEHWVLYAKTESWDITSKTNDALYIS